MDRRSFIQNGVGLGAGLLATGSPDQLLSAAKGAGVPAAGVAGVRTDRPGSRVAFDRRSLFIDGQRKFILGAAFHFFRSPDPEVWKERILALKALGMNAIETYFFWGYHSPAPGQYDFAGTRDVDRFMDLVEEAGMYLIARPGPYICAEVDGGGLPGWLIAKKGMNFRCRTTDGKSVYDPEYMKYVREWYEQITPKIIRRPNLILFQIENEYNLMGTLPQFVVDLLRVVGPDIYYQASNLSAVKKTMVERQRSAMKTPKYASSCQYMKELNQLARELGVKVPLIHNDAGSPTTRWVDVDIAGVDDYPIMIMDEKWKRQSPFGSIDLMEDALNALGKPCPLIIPELQGGWYDRWGGRGYQVGRDALGPEAMDMTLKSALAQGAALINIYMTVGGTNWGYTADPDVYTSYDYGTAITEGGAVSARAKGIANFAEFAFRHEEDLMTSAPDPHLSVDRRGVFVKARTAASGNSFIFARNLSGSPQKFTLPNGQPLSLTQPDMQVIALDEQGKVMDASGLAVDRTEPKRPTFTLPALGPFSFSIYSEPLDPNSDDSAWKDIAPGAAMDLDALGFYYGFAWYRGHYSGALESFKLDARHCWAAYLDGEPLYFFDNFLNKLGAAGDISETKTVRVPAKLRGPGQHVLTILVESLGHNKGFMPDFALPRGIVSLDTGKTALRWKAKSGLLPGESGMTPVLDVAKLPLANGQTVSLPHQAPATPAGLGLYAAKFNLSLPSRTSPVGLRIGRAPEKAVIYLNGALIGRYWDSVGPQKLFFLMPPFINSQGENQLLIALWPWGPKFSLDQLHLEVYP